MNTTFVFRGLHALITLAFCASAAVQWNDPDPWPWIVIYGAAALVTGSAALARASKVAALGVALVSLLWALQLSPHVIGQVTVPELFDSMVMKTESIEYGREFGGLVLIGVWMIVVLLTRPGRQP